MLLHKIQDINNNALKNKPILAYLSNNSQIPLENPGQNLRLSVIQYFGSKLLFNAVSGLSNLLPVETVLGVIHEGPNVLGPPR